MDMDVLLTGKTYDKLNDGSHTIILSTKGENELEVSEELVNFLKYVGQETDEAEIDDDYIKNLQEQIKSIKQNHREDIIKAVADREYQEKLFKEFNL